MSDPSIGISENSSTVVRDRALRVFFGAPSVRLTGRPDGVLPLQARSRIVALQTALLDAGVQIYSTCDDQGGWMSRDVGAGMADRVPTTFRAALGCDAAVAYIGTPLSAAVTLELGYAAALRKPVVLLVDRAQAYSELIAELENVTRVLPIVDNPLASPDDLRHMMITALDWVDEQDLAI